MNNVTHEAVKKCPFVDSCLGKYPEGKVKKTTCHGENDKHLVFTDHKDYSLKWKISSSRGERQKLSSSQTHYTCSFAAPCWKNRRWPFGHFPFGARQSVGLHFLKHIIKHLVNREILPVSRVCICHCAKL